MFSSYTHKTGSQRNSHKQGQQEYSRSVCRQMWVTGWIMYVINMQSSVILEIINCCEGVRVESAFYMDYLPQFLFLFLESNQLFVRTQHHAEPPWGFSWPSPSLCIIICQQPHPVQTDSLQPRKAERTGDPLNPEV